jgi:methylated-DNA-[protein]-cysteine S-methyltransferase
MSNNDLQPVWHWTIDTTLGDLTVVRDIEGLRGIYFPHHWYRPAQETFGPSIDRGFDETAQQLREYLAGDRQHFELPLQRTPADPLHTTVWELLSEIPYGSTTTYGELAQRIGQGVNAQQIGGAVGRNPLSIVVPCHRVIGSNGKLTGYAGGLPRKRHLLDLERAHVGTLDPTRAAEASTSLLW